MWWFCGSPAPSFGAPLWTQWRGKKEYIVEKLAEYFLEHLILDFEGALDMAELHKLVGSTPEGVKLLSVIKTDKDLDDFIFAMTDGLKEYLASGINREVLAAEFNAYTQQ